MSFGEKLYQLRKKENVSQEKLAEMIDVSRQAISKWEQGTAIPDTANLIKLCNCFDVPIDELMDERCECSRTSETRHNYGLIMLIVGLVIVFASIIITYPMKIIELKVHGECYVNPLYYLEEFPLNFTLAVGIILSIVGCYLTIKRRRGQ